MSSIFRHSPLWLVWVLTLPLVALGQDRFALVIGNAGYDAPLRLRNPAHDANALQAALQPLGFTVWKRTDVNLTEMEDVLAEFRQKLTQQSVALFYFAGHGLEVQGENYLLPLGTTLREEYEVKRKCLPVGQVLDALRESGSHLNVVILDCCRDNPLKRSWSRSTQRQGLAPIAEVPQGTLIAFSTAPGTVAADGRENNSPFTQQLCAVLQRRPSEGLELVETFREASRRVKQETNQIPWLNMEASLERFYLWKPPQPGYGETLRAPPASPSLEPAITNNLGMKLVLIEPRGLVMRGPSSGLEDEQRHAAQVMAPFYLGSRETSQSQWSRIMQTAPWAGKRHVRSGPDFPATYVSWTQAMAFCERLNADLASELQLPAGWHYTLPTETQWEYACRAGKGTAYCFGDTPAELDRYAWFLANTRDAGEEYAHQVGLKLPNELGLHDMHGNVWEWCREENDASETQPYRGGSWLYPADLCSSTARGHYHREEAYNDLGFRVALVKKEP